MKGIKIAISPEIPEGMMGPSVYNGINLETNKIVFSKLVHMATKNTMNFIGGVHGLMYMKKTMETGTVYIELEDVKKVIENPATMIYDPIKDAKAEKTNDMVAHCIRWLLEQKSGINVDLIKNLPQEHQIQQ